VRGIIIKDGIVPGGGGGLEFDLSDVLATLGERVTRSRWRARGLWYLSSDELGVDQLERLSAGATLDGHELLESLPRVRQVIDGEFEAREADSQRPWVIVRAVDSAWWEVLSDDPAVLAAIRARFRALEFFPVLPI